MAEPISIQFSRFSAFYSPLIATMAAGFLAAASGSPITRPMLIRAIRREYENAGRSFPGLPAGMSAV